MEISSSYKLNLVDTASASVQSSDLRALSRATSLAVQALNKTEYYGSDRQLSFGRDPQTQIPVIKIMNRHTGEVVDQIPPEEVVRIAASLEEMSGRDGTA
jgi:uncharacterized FlaG/YvyC family protein